MLHSDDTNANYNDILKSIQNDSDQQAVYKIIHNPSVHYQLADNNNELLFWAIWNDKTDVTLYLLAQKCVNMQIAKSYHETIQLLALHLDNPENITAYQKFNILAKSPKIYFEDAAKIPAKFSQCGLELFKNIFTSNPELLNDQDYGIRMRKLIATVFAYTASIRDRFHSMIELGESKPEPISQIYTNLKYRTLRNILLYTQGQHMEMLILDYSKAIEALNMYEGALNSQTNQNSKLDTPKFKA